ncbi:MAG TPA: hypothetical protein VM140_00990 [Burkholderiales bacterium]|nr:hypothetical protein [Burkholderiales bacterium]
MKLNLGCGNRKIPGWVNVDHSAACQPDQVVELESFPWPWPDGSVEEVLLNHSLEHMGETTAGYIGIIKELWRVCRAGASITIVVPHPRHDDFLGDPTHVRAITVPGLQLFSRKMNDQWIKDGAANTPLAIQHGVDFDVVHVETKLEEPWLSRLESKRMSEKEIIQDAKRYNNVVKEQKIVLKVVKTAGQPGS